MTMAHSYRYMDNHSSSNDARPEFTVYINEGEIYQIKKWVSMHQTIETGGDLFGLWLDDRTAVVQFVLGPGKKCRRTSVSFYQDIEYLRAAGEYLTQQHGLCNIGQWHSHHRLGLTRPSGGDENTVWGNMPNLGLNRYIVFIATIYDRYNSGYNNAPYRDEKLPVNINPYLFEIKNGQRGYVLQGCFQYMKENSPFRMHASIQNKVLTGAESFNRVKNYKKKDLKRPHENEVATESPERKQLKPKEDTPTPIVIPKDENNAQDEKVEDKDDNVEIKDEDTTKKDEKIAQKDKDIEEKDKSVEQKNVDTCEQTEVDIPSEHQVDESEHFEKNAPSPSREKIEETEESKYPAEVTMQMDGRAAAWLSHESKNQITHDQNVDHEQVRTKTEKERNDGLEGIHGMGSGSGLSGFRYEHADSQPRYNDGGSQPGRTNDQVDEKEDLKRRHESEIETESPERKQLKSKEYTPTPVITSKDEKKEQDEIVEGEDEKVGQNDRETVKKDEDIEENDGSVEQTNVGMCEQTEADIPSEHQVDESERFEKSESSPSIEKIQEAEESKNQAEVTMQMGDKAVVLLPHESKKQITYDQNVVAEQVLTKTVEERHYNLEGISELDLGSSLSSFHNDHEDIPPRNNKDEESQQSATEDLNPDNDLGITETAQKKDDTAIMVSYEQELSTQAQITENPVVEEVVIKTVKEYEKFPLDNTYIDDDVASKSYPDEKSVEPSIPKKDTYFRNEDLDETSKKIAPTLSDDIENQHEIMHTDGDLLPASKTIDISHCSEQMNNLENRDSNEDQVETRSELAEGIQCKEPCSSHQDAETDTKEDFEKNIEEGFSKTHVDDPDTGMKSEELLLNNNSPKNDDTCEDQNRENCEQDNGMPSDSDEVSSEKDDSNIIQEIKQPDQEPISNSFQTKQDCSETDIENKKKEYLIAKSEFVIDQQTTVICDHRNEVPADVRENPSYKIEDSKAENDDNQLQQRGSKSITDRIKRGPSIFDPFPECPNKVETKEKHLAVRNEAITDVFTASHITQDSKDSQEDQLQSKTEDATEYEAEVFENDIEQEQEPGNSGTEKDQVINNENEDVADESESKDEETKAKILKQIQDLGKIDELHEEPITEHANRDNDSCDRPQDSSAEPSEINKSKREGNESNKKKKKGRWWSRCLPHCGEKIGKRKKNKKVEDKDDDGKERNTEKSKKRRKSETEKQGIETSGIEDSEKNKKKNLGSVKKIKKKSTEAP